MLRVSQTVKHTPFELEDENGTVHKLAAYQYRITDYKRLVEMQKPVADNPKMNPNEAIEIIAVSRVICSVRVVETGDYYWQSIDEFIAAGGSYELVNELAKVVDKHNPLTTTDESLTEKKSD